VILLLFETTAWSKSLNTRKERATSLTEEFKNVRSDATLKRLQTEGYRKRRKLLRQCIPELPRFLYKFRSIAPTDETSIDRIRDVLVRSRLWLSSAIDFNDPFDMAAKFVAEGTAKQRREYLKELLKKHEPKLKERERKLQRLVAQGKAPFESALEEAHRYQVKSAGVYSFAGDPRSILMWSHYGANHEGLCLQFEVARDVPTFAHALPVEYSDEYPVVNWLTTDEHAMETVLLRKHTSWRYERERRIIILDAAHQYVKFNPTALRGIIIGCRAKESMIAKVRELIAERSAQGFSVPHLYMAVQHDTRYRLIIKRVAAESK
jgi:hypothetical protein